MLISLRWLQLAIHNNMKISRPLVLVFGRRKRRDKKMKEKEWNGESAWERGTTWIKERPAVGSAEANKKHVELL